MEKQISVWLPIFMNVIRFVVLAVLPFLLIYVCFPNYFKKFKIQIRSVKRSELFRELFYSLFTVLIFIGVSVLVIFTPLKEYLKIYPDINQYHWIWMPLSILAAIFIHDTYFYWLHRFLHHRKVYPVLHKVHHDSTNPSPFTSHSFNISESILEAMILPLILFLIPMHKIAAIGFIFIAIAYNVYGHLGYEIVPKWFRKSFLFELMVTSVHHNMHHEKFHGNYGYYFRIWDRLMGTENPNYERKFDEVLAKRSE